MIRLMKSLFAVLIILIAGNMRKGRLIYLIVPGLILLSLTGGILIGSAFNRHNNLPANSFTAENLNDDLSGTFIGMSFNYAPSISKDGQYIAFSEVQLDLGKVKDVVVKLYDTKSRRYIDLPGIHNKNGWDLSPSINSDGNVIVFQSNRKGKTNWDIYLYDCKARKIVDLPRLNSIFPDFNPSISPDGKYITFNSVRALIPKVYVYNTEEKKVSPLFEESIKE